MLTHELDGVMCALDDVYAVHSKKIVGGARNFWCTQVFSGHEYQACLNAVNECGRASKYAPKPDEVIAAIKAKESHKEGASDLYRGNCPRTLASLQSTLIEPAADNIGDAWRIYHTVVRGGTTGLDGKEIKTTMTEQEALIIVNKQCAKWGQPDAIAPEYKINSYYTD